MDFSLSLNVPAVDETAADKVVPVSSDILYDIIIAGGGPAAMTAAVYAMRKGMRTALVTEGFGGQVAETAAVENYMGYRFIEGSALSARFREQIGQFEIAIASGVTAQKIIPGSPHVLVCSGGMTVRGHSILAATGKSWRKLGIPGEKELTGRGVAYCTICDAPLFKNRDVVVFGGGNSSVESAIDLSHVASKVTLVHRGDSLRADKALADLMMSAPNVSIVYNHVGVRIDGALTVESVTIQNVSDGVQTRIPAAGVFVAIGLVPNSAWIKDAVSLNPQGEINIDERCATNTPGIFAAGDVTTVPFKQIIIAAGEGAKAALSAYEYVRSLKKGAL